MRDSALDMSASLDSLFFPPHHPAAFVTNRMRSDIIRRHWIVYSVFFGGWMRPGGKSRTTFFVSLENSSRFHQGKKKVTTTSDTSS